MAGWPNLSELVSNAHAGAPVGLVGAPLTAGSVTPGRCDLAPGILRQTLRRIGRYDVETGRELQTQIFDHGDVPVDELSIEDATPLIRDKVGAGAGEHALTLLAGGNNAVTRPAVLALGELSKVGLITLDAHLDMRDLDQGLGNGNPVRALIEDGLPGRNIAQVGLAGFANSKAMHEDAVAAGNNVITIGDASAFRILANAPRLYFGAHLRMNEVSHSLARLVATRPLKKDDEVRVELDGEVVGRLPATFEIMPRALNVRCP